MPSREPIAILRSSKAFPDARRIHFHRRPRAPRPGPTTTSQSQPAAPAKHSQPTAGTSPKTNLAPSHRRPRPCNPSRPPPTTSQSQPTSQPPLSQPTAGPARKPTASLHALPRYSALRETPCRAWEMLMRKSPIFSRASRMLR